MAKIIDIDRLKQTLSAVEGKLSELASATLEAVKGCVPTSRKVNGKALSADITLAASDVGAAQVPTAVSLTVPTTGWTGDSDINYPKYCDISISGLTAKHRVIVALSLASMSCARDCGLCPVCESMSGKLRIRAKTVPTQALSGEYYIDK